MTELKQARLKELFHYEPATGDFVSRVTRRCVKLGQRIGASDGQGYVRVNVDGVRYRAHRLAWLYVYGCWPSQDIDHINGERADNRIDNLRDVTRKMNLQNAQKKVPGVSGLLGVTPKGQRFVAQITANYKNVYLGRFNSAEEAHAAYVGAKRRLHEGNTL